MQFTNAVFLVIAATTSVLGNPVERRDGCHKSNDSIGKYCAFQNKQSWQAAVDLFCNQYPYGIPVPQGGSYGLKMADMPDGAGGQQIFWGNWRVDRGGDLMIQQADCEGTMQKIYDSCGGFGGWVNTDFGTVFGECIRQ